ncbi:MAG: hypothetical protein NTV00_04150, partial [Methylococcales bacterium]|nr:hypothetical protein [Methylococcales bacterium]
LIGHSNNHSIQNTIDGFGRNIDTVVLLRDKNTLSVFQVTRTDTCKNIKFSTPVPIEVSWKGWNVKDWSASKVINNGDKLSLPTDKYWWLLKIKAPATNQNGTQVDAECAN